jgi:hypothetical protein
MSTARVQLSLSADNSALLPAKATLVMGQQLI